MALIHEAIIKIMSEVGGIEKNRKNTGQGYQFRGIDDVYLAFQPLLAKHGVFIAPKVIDDRHEERTTKSGGVSIYRVLTIEYTFYASDGSCIQTVVIGEGMDSGDKASNKAMSVAQKYAILQVFSVPTSDPKDPENDDHDIAPKQQPKQTQAPKSFSNTNFDPGDYVVKIGKKFKDKRLREVDEKELISFSKWLQDDAAKQNKRLNPQAEEFINAVDLYLANSGAFSPQGAGNFEEVPF